MIRINLLPIRTSKKQEAVRREALLAMAGGAIALFAGLSVWGVTQLELSGVQGENRALQNEIDKLSADAKRVDDMEKFEHDLQRKLDVIDDLRGKKAGPVHMLDDMSTAAPEKLTLIRLNQKGDNLEIEGIAQSNTMISEYLRSLEASPYFETVFLKDIEAVQPDKTQPVTLKKFKLTARTSSVKVNATDKTIAKPLEEGAPVPAGAATQPGTPVPAPAAPASGHGAPAPVVPAPDLLPAPAPAGGGT
ncbi:MAG: hypothetical protein EXR69_08650 [Myxococcales bacterium]|nr:hypothetical protein [Myxococcales bacterium]